MNIDKKSRADRATVKLPRNSHKATFINVQLRINMSMDNDNIIKQFSYIFQITTAGCVRHYFQATSF